MTTPLPCAQPEQAAGWLINTDLSAGLDNGGVPATVCPQSGATGFPLPLMALTQNAFSAHSQTARFTMFHRVGEATFRGHRKGPEQQLTPGLSINPHCPPALQAELAADGKSVPRGHSQVNGWVGPPRSGRLPSCRGPESRGAQVGVLLLWRVTGHQVTTSTSF